MTFLLHQVTLTIFIIPMCSDQHPNWSNCELQILSCKQVKWPSSLVETQYRVAQCGWESREHAYECSVRLLTGRTHQVMFPLCLQSMIRHKSRFSVGLFQERFDNIIMRISLGPLGDLPMSQ